MSLLDGPTLAWIIGAAVLSGGGTLLLTPLVIKAARARDWVDRPRTDRWHDTPTALMGGLALYGAGTIALVVLGMGALFTEAAGLDMGGVGIIWVGATLLFSVGLVDDRWGLGPVVKLAAQAAAVGLLVGAGYSFGPGWPLWVSLPVTLVWVIGITNAVNLLDNMDGLAAGVTAIAAFVLAALAAIHGAPAAGLLGGVLGGAAVSFLAFNAKPARIFMGDCGSLFLGYLAASVALMVQPTGGGSAEMSILASIVVLAVPILDTTLVTVTRLRAGRSVAVGGRDHASHRLVALGWSERGAVGTLYAVGLGMGLTVLAAPMYGPGLFYGLVGLAAVGLLVFGSSLAHADVSRTGPVEVGEEIGAAAPRNGHRTNGAGREQTQGVPVSTGSQERVDAGAREEPGASDPTPGG